MSMMFRKLLPITLAVATAASAAAQEIQLPHVTVFGTATTEVVPDQMLWSVRVENKGPLLENVAEAHAKLVQAVLALLKESKVEEKVIQTSRMEFGENWEFVSGSRVRDGYFASTEISFKVSELNLYKKLWLGLSKLPGTSVASVTYDHSRRIDHQNETRRNAVLAAREKAMALARALAAELGEPLLIEEIATSDYPWSLNKLTSNNMRFESGDSPDHAEALSPGTIPIRMKVKAAFRLLRGQK